MAILVVIGVDALMMNFVETSIGTSASVKTTVKLTLETLLGSLKKMSYRLHIWKLGFFENTKLKHISGFCLGHVLANVVQ